MPPLRRPAENDSSVGRIFNPSGRVENPSYGDVVSGLTPKQYWRSLEDLAGGDAFRELLRAESASQGDATTWAPGLDRRRFLSLLGASLALAGAGGCFRPPREKIMPHVRAPEGRVPGEPLYYATAMTQPGGGALGLLVKSSEGRPTKVEGNPLHPASRGATDAFAQAELLTLYDPDRSRRVTHLGRTGGWDEFAGALRAALARHRGGRGAGLRILTESLSSPTLAAQLAAALAAYPGARWHRHEPAGRDLVGAGARAAFNEDVNVYYDFRKANVVLSLDADFLSCGPGHLAHVRDFTDRRRVRGDRLEMNRLYAVECTPGSTGAAADHRLPLRPSEVDAFARAVAARLGLLTGAEAPERFKNWNLAALADDLRRNRGTSLVVAGEFQPRAVQLLAHAMNDALGNIGSTVIVTDPIDSNPAAPGTLAELVDDMRAGRVETLLLLGGNPVYGAPADVDFGGALFELSQRPGAFTARLALYEDETSRLCQWHLPEAHFLEAWGDTRAFDGTASVIQPLIAPLYAGRSAHELLSLLTDGVERPGYEVVKDYWRRRRRPSGDFEAYWRRSLHDGLVDGTKLPPRERVRLNDRWLRELGEPPAPAQGFEVVFRPDPTVHDGRYANNGWLQELPKPLTKLTWDNAVLVSPATAAELGIRPDPGNLAASGYRGGEHGQALAPLVRVKLRDREVVAPAWLTPGQPDGVLTLHLGYGRTHAGKVGSNAGFDFSRMRIAAAPWADSGATVEPTGDTYTLACTQQHFAMEERDLVRSATLAEYRADPHFAAGKGHAAEQHGRVPLTLYPEYDYSPPKPKWGMAIDLTACTGCSACVVACQAENNIPVVGKEQVVRGREMHWLRVDRYFEGPPENPRTYFQPVPCMQCENAPCEVPCPVHATVHSDDGLNDMVYNRCVGTRYCSNNCPYKVRRFNFLPYADYTTESLRLMYNPDVTVRSVGVMEKCTYCVQRIRRAEVEREKRAVNGEPRGPWAVETACQQACPARAIIFGDANDRAAEVRRMKDEPRNFALLADLGTRPRTTYLAALRNPNPELEK